MANADVIKEFLVALGYRVDESGQRKFIDGIAAATLQVVKLGTAIEAAAVSVVTGVAIMANASEKLYFMSQRTRASVENIEAFGFAMSQVGSSVGQARAALEGMAGFLRSSPGAGNLLQSIGIDPNQDPAQITQRFFEYARQIPIWRARLYASMFGIDENTLLAGIKGEGNFFQVYQDLLRKSGLNVNQAAADAHGFMVELRTMFATLEILGQKINAALYRPLGQDLSRLQRLISENFDVISNAIAAVVRGIIKVAEIFTTLLIRGGQAVAGLMEWFDHLNPKLKAVVETIGAMLVAWRLLNAGFLATPLGIIVSLIAGLVLLYDDYKTWKEGGKSLIDWAAWEPAILKAQDAIRWLTDHLTELSDNTTGFHRVMEGLAIFMATVWAARMIAAIGSVAASMAPLVAAVTLLWGFADIVQRPFGSIASGADEKKLLADERARRGEGPAPPGGGGIDLAREAIDFFMSPEGGSYDLAHAAGIAASAQRESQYGSDPRTNTGDHRGIFQWSASRAAAIAAHFGKRVEEMTRQEQYGALAWEISEDGPEATAGRMFRGAAGGYGAGREFSHAVERPGSAGEDIARGDLSERLLQRNLVPLSSQSITIQQANPIHITGVSDPQRAADLAGSRVDRSNADLLRNLTGSVR